MSTDVVLDGPTDTAGFRRHARALVARGVPPAAVCWRVAGDAPTLLGDAHRCDDPHAAPAGAPPLRVPASFVALCDDVLLHREPQRFALMYRLLWRLREDPAAWHDRLHPDRRQAEQLARDVRHDLHDMRAYVRFTPVDTPQGVCHVAWFEPTHHVVAANATFFSRRFARMRWAILTPDLSMAWDGERLSFGPGGDRRDAPPPDAGAALWLTYYQHIFNPARLKVDTLVRQMPQRYWANLPEAQLIEPLVAGAQARADAMVAAEPTAPRRIRPIVAPDR